LFIQQFTEIKGVDFTMANTVLVTGATGFLALHCIRDLLAKGYNVRGTLRNLGREGEVRKAVGADDGRLTLVKADLTEDGGWAAAVDGCDFILHTASPFPAVQPSDPEVVIRPAVDGTLRVLRAATTAGVKRVVLTSSTNAIAGDKFKPAGYVYTEADWTDLSDTSITPYDRSKTLAEKAAWKFVGEQVGAPELVVVAPGAIFGPLLGPDLSSSGQIIRSIMTGSVPGAPRIGFAPIDVRDVSAAHIAAMENPKAAGRRFLCAIDQIWLVDVSRLLSERYTAKGFKIPVRQLPDWLVKVGALWNPALARAATHLGRTRRVNNDPLKNVLGIQPRSFDEMITSMADSLIAHGIVSAPAK
jgi:dihydroflavonol-4-reductase